MTDAGELWIDEVVYKDEDTWPDAAERRAARLALQAFCDEVERRRWKKDFYVDSYDVFLQLKSELLG